MQLASITLVLGTAIGLARGALPLAAEPQPPPPKLRLYLDCAQSLCDFAFLQREIPWVDWVRERADADVQILVTTQDTGSGGSEGRLFVTRPRGGGPAADTLRLFSPPTASDDDSRRQLARAIEAVLARDVATRPEGDHLEIRIPPPPAAGAAKPPPEPRDRWNRWVFSIGTNGYVNGEHSYDQTYLYSSFSATRVTEASRLGVLVGQSYNDSRYRFDDGTRFTSITRSWNVHALGVRPLSGRWSVGSSVNVWSSTFSNVRLSYGVGPAIEMDVWPYAESSRRSLTIGWQLYASRSEYEQITLYGRTNETRLAHELDVGLSEVQPWGSLSLGTSLFEYLHDASKYHLNGSLNANLKLFRGLSLTAYGYASRIHDQLSLPRGTATDSEVLARQRLLASSYSFYSSFGLTYRFGSIFNSAVNTRLVNTLGTT